MSKIKLDYIPEDLKLCAKCIFWEICPYDYVCDTFERMQEYERQLEYETLGRDGDKVAKGEE